jgi:glyoxylase-like metal-dependent hydrolase (beta-lactamase superfamily II)
VNFYLVQDEGRATVVDAGLPAFWEQVEPALDSLGLSLDDIEAVVLTHAHSDHTGIAGRLHERSIPVLLHEGDRQMLATGKPQKRDASMLPYLRRGAAWRLFLYMGRNGGLRPPKIDDAIPIADGEELDVPGRPRVVHTPGHSLGHCAIHFERHGVLFAGDMLCTWNPLTGRRGPQVMPSALNGDTDQCFRSLERIEGLTAEAVLPGHGEPWREGPAAAVEQARRAGRT